MLSAWVIAVHFTVVMSARKRLENQVLPSMTKQDLASPGSLMDRQMDSISSNITSYHEIGQNLVFRPGDRAVNMPKVPGKADVRVFYAEVPISGLDAMAALDQYHSGVTFKYLDSDGKSKSWTVELYAEKGLGQAVCPSVDDETGLPTWDSGIVVGFKRGTLNEDPKHQLKEQDLGLISGAVFNEYHKFIEEYMNQHPIYQLFDIMPFDADWGNKYSAATQRTVKAETCDSFTQASLMELYRLDPSRLVRNPEIKQNYQLLLSQKTGVSDGVELSNGELKHFFKKFSDTCKRKLSFHDVWAAAKNIYKGSAVAFIHTKTTNFRVPLAGKGAFFQYAPMPLM